MLLVLGVDKGGVAQVVGDDDGRVQRRKVEHGNRVLRVVGHVGHQVDGSELHACVTTLDSRDYIVLPTAVPKELRPESDHLALLHHILKEKRKDSEIVIKVIKERQKILVTERFRPVTRAISTEVYRAADLSKSLQFKPSVNKSNQIKPNQTNNASKQEKGD